MAYLLRSGVCSDDFELAYCGANGWRNARVSLQMTKTSQGVSIFQFRYEPEGAGVQAASTNGLIWFKEEVEGLIAQALQQGCPGSFGLREFFKSCPCQAAGGPPKCHFFASPEFNLRASSLSTLFCKAGKQLMLGSLHFLCRSKIRLLLGLCQQVHQHRLCFEPHP
jgi:hypothetical protein